jgi:hypothetical protein
MTEMEPERRAGRRGLGSARAFQRMRWEWPLRDVLTAVDQLNAADVDRFIIEHSRPSPGSRPPPSSHLGEKESSHP